MGRKTIVGTLLLVAAVAGLLFSTSYQRTSMAQEAPLSPTMNPSPPQSAELPGLNRRPALRPSVQFSGPSAGNLSRPTRTVRKSAAEQQMTLIRASYRLPKQATETLTKLFAIESTSLVECKTEPIEDSTLVMLVVTAEPSTQNAIAQFIGSVFPAELQTEHASKTVPLPEFQIPTIQSNVSVPDGGTIMIGGKIKMKTKPQPSTVKRKQFVTLKVDEVSCGACVQQLRTYLEENKAQDITFDQEKLTVSFSLKLTENAQEFLETAREESPFLANSELVAMKAIE